MIARWFGLFFLESAEVKAIKEKIQSLLEPILQRSGAFVVDVDVHTDRGQKVIQAFVDTDSGITIEQCAEMSRELSRELPLTQLVHGDYQLEISSPGLDRPLRLLRQYHKNLGRKFRVIYKVDEETRFMIATLTKIENNELTFEDKKNGDSLMIPFESIIESKEELPW